MMEREIRIAQLAEFLHREVMYDHSDPRSGKPVDCEICKERAERIVDFLRKHVTEYAG